MLPSYIADSLMGIEIKHQQVNGRIHQYLFKDCGAYLEYSGITSDIHCTSFVFCVFARDGVHLADIAIDMMIFQFRECIESLL